MTKKSREQKLIRRRQKRLYKKFICSFTLNVLVIFAIMMIALLVGASGNNQIEGKNQMTVYESEDNHNAVTLPANTPSETTNTIEEEVYCRNLTDYEKLLLAKIAMAEAEGESIETKMYVIMTVLNRVESNQFPDTVEKVIFEEHDGVYQFSPVMFGGRWWTTEPNEECWVAVEIINETEHDVSKGALYFESCKNPDNWHSRNLEFLFESDGMRFYK